MMSGCGKWCGSSCNHLWWLGCFFKFFQLILVSDNLQEKAEVVFCCLPHCSISELNSYSAVEICMLLGWQEYCGNSRETTVLGTTFMGIPWRWGYHGDGEQCRW